MGQQCKNDEEQYFVIKDGSHRRLEQGHWPNVNRKL
jgi:hypothetical protein